MKVYLIDGTYELFRHFYALPAHANRYGEEVAAVRGVLGSLFSLINDGVTHIAVATDHVIESFRNDLWSGYKDGSGIDPRLRSQFGLLETALEAAGFLVWPMIEFEADDALAAGAAICAADERVEQVIICTPDKDLAQCVRQDHVVQLDRRRKKFYNGDGVREKFGVGPEFIPDYLALVGDSADGYPGLRGWGPKTTASAINRYGHLETFPAGSFGLHGENVMLFRRLATLVTEGVIASIVDDLMWRGPSESFAEVSRRLDWRLPPMARSKEAL